MKEHTEKLYKVINNKNQSMNGGEFDWTKHLPTKNKPGKWTPRITNPEICSEGYHLTKHWNFWINTKTDKVFECEAKNITEWDDDKCICGSVRLIKEVKLDFKDEKMNTGKWNTGDWNTGHLNTGSLNTGDLNTGSRNTGSRNTGDCNTGYRNTGNRNTGNNNTGEWNTGYRNTGNNNTGDRNTGDRNTGDWNTGNNNTGDRNTGEWNTGEWNTGEWNTGYRNTGSRNTGDRNTGYRNTGNWNTGSRNTGCFNTKTPEYYELFNQKITKKEYENTRFPNYFYFELEKNKTYKECWNKSFKEATLKEIEQTIKLPNFNYEVFWKVTGITKKEIMTRLK